jgi:subtilisin family serine protease
MRRASKLGAQVAVMAAMMALGTAHAGDRYLVQLQDLERGRAAVAGQGGEVLLELGPQRAVAARLSPQAVEALSRHPDILLIEPDVLRYPLAQTVPYGIPLVQADQVWASATGANRKVCVIDSGLWVGHEDLQTSGVTGYPTGWNTDACGHGTHVTGTIAALNNTRGVVGVLPNGVSLHVVKVFGDNCSWTYSSTLIDAANRCRDAGANVISMSLGGSFKSSTEERAFADLYRQGLLSVAAAGNGGNTRYSYPASYTEVISVGAIDANKKLASFSQRNDQVELVAPGVAVLSTVPWSGGQYPASGYESWNGTSMATPHVSAVVALIWSYDTSWTHVQIREALQKTAEDLGTAGRDNSYGHGLVRARAALDYLEAGSIIISPDGIELTVTPWKLKGVQRVDLLWNGATGTQIDVYRDGQLVTTTANDGAHTDVIGARGGGSYAYRVCQAGSSVCSETVTATF